MEANINVGGFLGATWYDIRDGELLNSYATGRVKGKRIAGGLVGFFSEHPIIDGGCVIEGFNCQLKKCYSVGSVNAESEFGDLIGK